MIPPLKYSEGDLQEQIPRAKPVSTKDLLQNLLIEQRSLTAVEEFAQQHADIHHPLQAKYYQNLIPVNLPQSGEQFAFEVDLDRCSSCKACVSACHSLNGLGDDEIWRSVGVLHPAVNAGQGQVTVTTACHHCLEPGCLEGCPVTAYEKDVITGIVRHLNDQCIGCQYCVMKCPYDVPKYSPHLGIIRKCDMCHDRLKSLEAPACVQACPNEAIKITIVSTASISERAANGVFLPDSPDPGYTKPGTVYTSSKPIPSNMLGGDHDKLIIQDGHWPLAVMLVLTQAGIGFLGAQIIGSAVGVLPTLANRWMALLGLIIFSGGMASSILHLGQPLKAWRFFLGLRTSWLSREILAFGVLTLLATVYVLALWTEPILEGLSTHSPSRLISGWIQGQYHWVQTIYPAVLPIVSVTILIVGITAVFTSVMVYAVTRRQFWRWEVTLPRFLGTVIIFGLFGLLYFTLHFRSFPVDITLLIWAVVISCTFKILGEMSLFLHLRDRGHPAIKRTAILLRGPLKKLMLTRIISGIAGGIFLPLLLLTPNGHPLFVASLSLGFWLLGEFTERSLFFKAVSPDKMPGGI
ncbi:MAG: DmsC/YnfH family molybdoenzyme membrane anchor subunit [Verrucomicrobiota bacterium]|nr:DmsC/YnfH family molybdoenzyme membrane anchor subunit [Verrucomicrobiota bacterium]